MCFCQERNFQQSCYLKIGGLQLYWKKIARIFHRKFSKIQKRAFLQKPCDKNIVRELIQLRSIARVWNTHFIIFSFRARSHFQKKFFEGNLPFIPPNIIISWVQSVSTNTCNWKKLGQDNNKYRQYLIGLKNNDVMCDIERHENITCVATWK